MQASYKYNQRVAYTRLIKSKPNYRKPFIIYIMSVIILIMGWIILPRYLVHNITISEPIGWYWLSSAANIKIGHIYTLTIPNSHLNVFKQLGLKDNIKLLKKVVAKEGDVVQVSKAGILINNKLIPNSQSTLSHKGIALYPLTNRFNYKLKPNEYFLLGETKNSLDSRYFGIVNKNQIINEAHYLFQ